MGGEQVGKCEKVYSQEHRPHPSVGARCRDTQLWQIYIIGYEFSQKCKAAQRIRHEKREFDVKRSFFVRENPTGCARQS